MSRIVIHVSGGLIQDIEGIPPGLTIEVRDYDVDDQDDAEWENGERFARSEWTHRQDAQDDAGDDFGPDDVIVTTAGRTEVVPGWTVEEILRREG